MDILSNAFVSTHFERGSNGDALLDAYENGLSKKLFEHLWSWYPGYNWHTAVDAKGGIARIRIGGLMRSSYWFNLHLSDLASDPSYLAVKRAGGQLLEMLKLRRGRYDRDAVKTLRSAENGIYSQKRPMAGMEKGPTRILTEAEAQAFYAAQANENRSRLAAERSSNRLAIAA